MNTLFIVKLLTVFLLFFSLSTATYAADEHSHEQEEEHEDDHGEQQDSIEIEPEMAAQVGIRTAIAGSGIIERHVQVYGRLATPPDQWVEVRARFPGIIRAVEVNVGDSVEQDDVLAIVESDQSLQNYQIKAPLAATVQSRMANVGEITGDQPLLQLVNNKQLWAELKVFPGQRSDVRVGHSVHVVHNGHSHDSQIANIITDNAGEPYVLARVPLENTDGEMVPGDLVTGQIDVEKVEVSLLVDNRALQTLEGNTVVFVLEGDHYIAHSLTLGISDNLNSQVLEGLESGDHYVVENSYLIKADIEKSGASHQH